MNPIKKIKEVMEQIRNRKVYQVITFNGKQALACF